MKVQYDLIVVIPVGPGTQLKFLKDTMESVIFYTSGRLKFILIDDSQLGTTQSLKDDFPDMDILTVPKNLGKVGGLYISLANAYRYAYEHYDFELLLRMDDDALMTGPDAHLDGLKILAAKPDTGLIGWHIRGRTAIDSFGNVHDNYWPRKQLKKDTATWKIIRRPLANIALRQLRLQAADNGYEIGENIQGGAYFITRACIGSLMDAGLLPMQKLGSVNLCEDHLFSLLAKAVGKGLQDLSKSGQPFGICWKGLAASPEHLLIGGKKIIHSVRFWHHLQEDQIRGIFKYQRRRAQYLHQPNEAPTS